MAGDSKTEAPTPRRRADARNRGQVGKSMEVGSVAVLFTALLMLGYIGGDALMILRAVAREAFLQVGMPNQPPEALLALAVSMVGRGGASIAPLVGAVAITGVVVNLVQVGPFLSLQPLRPDVSRLNPLVGFQKFFSSRSFVELAKSAVKFGVMGFVAYQVIKERYSAVMGLQVTSPEGALVTLGGLILEIGWKCGLALLVMAAADITYQRRSLESSLKMSKQEVKDEARQSEGDPHLKGKLKQMARQLSSRRMMLSVPNADVVVTNPVHLAVALEYKQDRMQAPMVTAKGQLQVAEQIKRVAREHGVPIVENPPLARALYRSVEIGTIVPPALYQAVAEILAFIYRLRDRASGE